MLFNRKINTRLNLLRYSLNRQNLKKEKNIPELYTSKKLRTFTLGDTIWYRNFQKRNKWERGIVIKKTGPVTYLFDNCHGILINFVLLMLTQTFN